MPNLLRLARPGGYLCHVRREFAVQKTEGWPNAAKLWPIPASGRIREKMWHEGKHAVRHGEALAMRFLFVRSAP